jgi:multiple antibiotic resistance protein
MDFSFFVFSFTAIFLIVNPLGILPIFIGLLEGFSKKDRQEIIKKATILAATVLAVFTAAGDQIFQVLGIQMYSFRVAGGILLFTIAMEMLHGRRTRTKSTQKERDEALDKEDIAITPLAIPLLTGPGALTTGVVLFDAASSMEEKIIIFVSIGLVYFVSYLILSRSEKLFDALGYTGTRVIVRIMGLLLAAIAVQFVFDGIQESGIMG